MEPHKRRRSNQETDEGTDGQLHPARDSAGDVNIDDFRCALCSELLIEPIPVSCGHDFCRVCLHRFKASCDEAGTNYICPVCRHSIHPSSFGNGVSRRLQNLIQRQFPRTFASRQRELGENNAPTGPSPNRTPTPPSDPHLAGGPVPLPADGQPSHLPGSAALAAPQLPATFPAIRTHDPVAPAAPTLPPDVSQRPAPTLPNPAPRHQPSPGPQHSPHSAPTPTHQTANPFQPPQPAPHPPISSAHPSQPHVDPYTMTLPDVWGISAMAAAAAAAIAAAQSLVNPAALLFDTRQAVQVPPQHMNPPQDPTFNTLLQALNPWLTQGHLGYAPRPPYHATHLPNPQHPTQPPHPTAHPHPTHPNAHPPTHPPAHRRSTPQPLYANPAHRHAPHHTTPHIPPSARPATPCESHAHNIPPGSHHPPSHRPHLRPTHPQYSGYHRAAPAPTHPAHTAAGSNNSEEGSATASSRPNTAYANVPRSTQAELDEELDNGAMSECAAPPQKAPLAAGSDPAPHHHADSALQPLPTAPPLHPQWPNHAARPRPSHPPAGQDSNPPPNDHPLMSPTEPQAAEVRGLLLGADPHQLGTLNPTLTSPNPSSTNRTSSRLKPLTSQAPTLRPTSEAPGSVHSNPGDPPPPGPSTSCRSHVLSQLPSSRPTLSHPTRAHPQANGSPPSGGAHPNPATRPPSQRRTRSHSSRSSPSGGAPSPPTTPMETGSDRAPSRSPDPYPPPTSAAILPYPHQRAAPHDLHSPPAHPHQPLPQQQDGQADPHVEPHAAEEDAWMAAGSIMQAAWLTARVCRDLRNNTSSQHSSHHSG